MNQHKSNNNQKDFRKVRQLARSNRKHPTDAEKKLWHVLRNHKMAGVHFRRQHKIGRYIVDFVCLERKLIIELDGGQHAIAGNIRHDLARSKFLNRLGYRVVRFWNHEVLKELDMVMEVVFKELSP